MERRVTGFHQDGEGHWVAELECGHNQHVRHDPPWECRPWVVTPEGRRSRLGMRLNCLDRDDQPSRIRGPWYNGRRIRASGQGQPTMPPNEECPNCHRVVEDWHIEWYKSEGPLLYNGLAAMDCPLCGQPVGFRQGKIGPAPPGVPLVRRYADKAAEWAPLGAKYAGGTLHEYASAAGPGNQYASYWTGQQVQQADSNERAKRQGP